MVIPSVYSSVLLVPTADPCLGIVGQIPFNSTISGITEQLPVTVSLVARRGCDFVLLDLLHALARNGIVGSVKTGRTAF